MTTTAKREAQHAIWWGTGYVLAFVAGVIATLFVERVDILFERKATSAAKRPAASSSQGARL
jgi:hypothetical protein